jgi:putative phage-type endonuclease
MLTVEQKSIRQQGLGATDAAVVMGLSPYKTPYELWLEKTGRKEEEPILNDSRLRLRHAHEETIAREYAAQFDVKLKRVNQTIYHKELPFMLCHLDRVVIGKKKIVECKSSSGFLRPAWGESGSDEAPLHYILQVQHQLACTEYQDADIAALIDIDDYRIYPMPRNEKIIAKIEDACERFWHTNVLADVPPPASNRADLKLMYPSNNGKLIGATYDIEMLISTITARKENIKSIEAEKEREEKELIEFIADNDGIIDSNGKTLATFIANKNGTRTLRIK